MYGLIPCPIHTFTSNYVCYSGVTPADGDTSFKNAPHRQTLISKLILQIWLCRFFQLLENKVFCFHLEAIYPILKIPFICALWDIMWVTVIYPRGHWPIF